MPDSNLPETEHLEVDKAAYQQLTRQAIDEVFRCLLATEVPSELTTEKVRNRVRVFAACSTEPWARAMNVIQHKSDDRGVPQGLLREEYYRLVRLLRNRLVGSLLGKKRDVWEEARKRMVGQAEYAILRVKESTVHLHRLTPNCQYQRYA